MPLLAIFGKKHKTKQPIATSTTSSKTSISHDDHDLESTEDYIFSPPAAHTPTVSNGSIATSYFESQTATKTVKAPTTPLSAPTSRLRFPFRRKQTSPPKSPLNDSFEARLGASARSEADLEHALRPPPPRASIFSAYEGGAPRSHSSQSLPESRTSPSRPGLSPHQNSDPRTSSFTSVSGSASPSVSASASASASASGSGSGSGSGAATKSSTSIFSWTRERTKSKPSKPSPHPTPATISTSSPTLAPPLPGDSFNLKSFRHVRPESPAERAGTPPSSFGPTTATASSPSSPYDTPIAQPRPRGSSVASDSSQRISVAAFREAQARRSATNLNNPSPSPGKRPISLVDSLRASTPTPPPRPPRAPGPPVPPAPGRSATAPVVTTSPSTFANSAKVKGKANAKGKGKAKVIATPSSSEDEEEGSSGSNYSEDEEAEDTETRRGKGAKLGRQRTITQRTRSDLGHYMQGSSTGAGVSGRSDVGHGSSPYRQSPSSRSEHGHGHGNGNGNANGHARFSSSRSEHGHGSSSSSSRPPHPRSPPLVSFDTPPFHSNTSGGSGALLDE
ncbi:hypothetical protein BD410DRAFT_321895 [Rickenella mellea]|uniref:Uncharacterized protein n=1 Tax=Rickenella mellea TaxID=50990 RepID=A0A4Y7Q0V3_9AGAM|nr:hypothetical protein BD410DRAFT_321895 [Rickenella mellea]